MREFGESKLGAVGRPYRDVDLQIRSADGSEAGPGERGEIFVRSPFRMGGYAGDGASGADDAEERFVDGTCAPATSAGLTPTGSSGWRAGSAT